MADFLRALPFVLRNEGGECDVKGDSGGHTNMGITQATLDGFNRAHPELQFPANVHDLTQGDVGTIYRLGYWKFDGIQDQACATKIFDCDVNDGLPSGIRLAQRAAISLGAHLTEDGAYGPATEAALNACNPSHLMDALIKVSTAHYQSMAAQHPEDVQFLRTWLARAGRIPLG